MSESNTLPSAGKSHAHLFDGRFLDIDDLSEATGIAKATIYSDLCRAPWKLPQGYRLPGRRKLLWDREEVIAWIKRLPNRTLDPMTATNWHAARRRSQPCKQAEVRQEIAATAELRVRGGRDHG